MDIDPVDPAVQAFEALRTEIAVLTAEIAAVLAEQRAIVARPVPDYDLTLGRIAKQLAELTARVAGVEGKPALAFTAHSFGNGLAAIVREEGELARVVVRQAGLSVREEAEELTKAAGKAMSRSAWRRRVTASMVCGLILGVAVCFGAVEVFPAMAGSWIAATIVGQDPWIAGQTLMRTADRTIFERMVRLSNACGDQSTELCEAAIAVRTIPPLTSQAPPASTAPRGRPPARQ